jgi:hypothetical protein
MKRNATPRYRCCLLRAWEEHDTLTGRTTWRFSLEDTRTGQRRGFASLEALTAALQAEIADQADTPSGGCEP